MANLALTIALSQAQNFRDAWTQYHAAGVLPSDKEKATWAPPGYKLPYFVLDSDGGGGPTFSQQLAFIIGPVVPDTLWPGFPDDLKPYARKGKPKSELGNILHALAPLVPLVVGGLATAGIATSLAGAGGVGAQAAEVLSNPTFLSDPLGAVLGVAESAGGELIAGPVAAVLSSVPSEITDLVSTAKSTAKGAKALSSLFPCTNCYGGDDVASSPNASTLQVGKPLQLFSNPVAAVAAPAPAPGIVDINVDSTIPILIVVGLAFLLLKGKK